MPLTCDSASAWHCKCQSPSKLEPCASAWPCTVVHVDIMDLRQTDPLIQPDIHVMLDECLAVVHVAVRSRGGLCWLTATPSDKASVCT